LTFTNTALLVAANLAVLTYNIGVLIYALPVPSRRLKRLAPKLIEDGLYAAVIVTGFTALLYASDYIAAISTLTLADVANWLHSILNMVFIEYYTAKLFSAILAFIPGGGAAASRATRSTPDGGLEGLGRGSWRRWRRLQGLSRRARQP